MENDDGRKFRELLQEWRVPGVPKSLDERVLGLRRPWWTFLLTGSILSLIHIYYIADRPLLPRWGFDRRSSEDLDAMIGEW